MFADLLSNSCLTDVAIFEGYKTPLSTSPNVVKRDDQQSVNRKLNKNNF